MANDQTDMEDLLKQLLTLSGGTSLTNMTRPKDEGAQGLQGSLQQDQK